MITTSKIKDYLKRYDPSLELGDVIGHGGTSIVYEVTDGNFKKQALKVIDIEDMAQAAGDDRISRHTRRRMREYCLNEIAVMNELKSCDYIVRINGFHEYKNPADRGLSEDEQSYRSVFLILMEYLMPFSDYAAENPINENLLISMTRDCANALDCCHKHNILHRDVKQGNIFVRQENGITRFVLGDFGYCRRLNKSGCVTSCGTDHFVAPEIRFGKNLHNRFNADIFSLGATLYFILTNGKSPSLYKSETSVPLAVDSISENFCNIVLKSTIVDPAKRYQTAQELLKDLDSISESNNTKNFNIGNLYQQAKLAMLKRDYDEAYRLAEDGVKNGEKGCDRLLAYLICRQSPDSEEERQRALKIIETSQTEPASKYLKGLLMSKSKSQKEREDSVKYIVDAAENGVSAAKYLYGCICYAELLGVKDHRLDGIELIMQSSQSGFLPAMQMHKKLLESGTHYIKHSPEMKQLLELELEDYGARKHESIIDVL